MALNKKLIDEISNVTSKAAISCYKFLGKNDKENADNAAIHTLLIGFILGFIVIIIGLYYGKTFIKAKWDRRSI